MSLLDLLILLVTLLIVWFAATPLIPTLCVALVVIILIRVSRGERLP